MNDLPLQKVRAANEKLYPYQGLGLSLDAKSTERSGIIRLDAYCRQKWKGYYFCLIRSFVNSSTVSIPLRWHDGASGHCRCYGKHDDTAVFVTVVGQKSRCARLLPTDR